MPIGISKKKILFLTPQLPYPPESGGTLATLQFIDFLSNNYKLNLLCLLKNQEDKFNENEFLSIYKNKVVDYKSFDLSSKVYSRNALISEGRWSPPKD